MSRLTSRAPFNRPSAFDVLPSRPAPLSPPETEMDAALVMPYEPRQDDSNSVSPESAAQQVPMTTESPGTHFRRVSNLAYTSSSLSRREPRPVQRQSRWLVMVVPPASLTREPPTLGHTLSSAPAGRFVNGILMPLFPTLYGQLTAIAREFNMPSTAGLCIYLQLSESGASMLTPRVSDESWQMLWGHFFAGDERAAPLPPHGLPISGRIEFDIDLRRARWFDAWMGNGRRERGESEVPSREPSVVPTHWRGDSRTSLFPTEIGVDETSPSEIYPPVTAVSSRTVMQRAVPRPLLLERRDASSSRSFSRPPSRGPGIVNEPPPPTDLIQTALIPPTEPPKALSPVAQEPEEPQTARKIDVQTKIHEWRQSSSVTGAANNALAAAGQPSLDPANMPSGADVELDLDDFQWSISSAGPPSESAVSADWPSHPPSVHILGRMQGSVCLTPSTATSFGPLDDDWLDSPVSCVSRRPSPDLGMRMLDYVPLTPTTATSWGPDDTSSIYSDYELEYRAPSIDIGVRGMGSRPVTPSTATSWGPPDSPLSLPPTPQYVRTPDAGERAFPDSAMPARAAPSLVFPYYNAWEAEPWGHVWPYQTHRHSKSTPVNLVVPKPRTRSKVLLPEWPDFAALYPSDPTTERAAANKSQPVGLPRKLGYPVLDIYPIAYPYNLDEIYPASFQGGQTHTHRLPDVVRSAPLPEWPDFASLYPSDPKTDRAAMNKSQPVKLPGLVGYPFLEIYPTAYPYNLEQIYPVHGIQSSSEASELAISRRNQLPQWPDFASLYPADLRMERAASNKSLPVALQRVKGYPYIPLYESVYPHSLEEIYPPVKSAFFETNTKPTSKTSEGPSITRSHLEYPDFAGLYPSDPRVERVGGNKSQPVGLPSLGYPFITVYPSVYPWNLADIYGPSQLVDIHTFSPALSSPGLAGSDASVTSRERRISDLLPEYPNFAGLYPSTPQARRTAETESRPVGLPTAGYPFILLYPPVYPWNLAEIYGPVQMVDAHVVAPYEPILSDSGISVRLPVYSGYPTFNLYPAESSYPSFEIYPPVVLESPVTLVSSSKLTPGYPTIELYEPVYPHLVIYPQTQLNAIEEPIPARPHSPRKRAQTPGPGRRRLHGLRSPLSNANDPEQLRRHSRSPVQKDLAVPPLPTASPDAISPPPPRRARLTHLELHRRVFGSESDSGPRLLEKQEVPRPAPRRRKTHDELRSVALEGLPREDTQGQDDIVPELPHRPTAPSPAPIRQRSRSSTVSIRESVDPSHHVSQRVVDVATEMPRTSSPTLVRQRSRSGTISSRAASDLPQEVSQALYDAVAELPHPVSATSPAPSRQRSRSGTVSSRASQPPAPPPPFAPPLPPTTNAGRARRPSVSMSAITPSSEASPSISSARSSLLTPPATVPQSSRMRSPLPASPYPIQESSTAPAPEPRAQPVRQSIVLSRVRSMNTPVRPVDTSPRGSGVGGLDRSKSLSDANGRGKARQSIVLERAKMFTVSEDGIEVTDVLPAFPAPPLSRTVSKLDRSKLPFE